MSAHLNIGNTWDIKLLEGIKTLESLYDEGVKVDTLYGCTSCNIFGNARAPARVQKLSTEETRNFICKTHEQKLQIAWTINVSCIGDTQQFITKFTKNRKQIENFFQYLGVDILIVSHPLLMILLSKYEIDIPVEVSTITNITEPNQLTHLVDIGCNIKRVCVPVGKNRDKAFLVSLVSVCEYLGIEIEVMVNELCFLDACNCEGLFRKSCYDMNAHATTANNTLDYPRGFCIKAREKDFVNWLRAKWVLPQHMQYYEEIGIHRFKITGRTHPTEFLLGLLPSYLKRNHNGNLLDLWAHLQIIGKDSFKEKQQNVTEKLDINSSGLDSFFNTVFEHCKNDCFQCEICPDYFQRLCDEGQVK